MFRNGQRRKKTDAMNIDERLQALTESLELLTSLHRDLEKQTETQAAETAARFKETAASFKQTAARFADIGEFINSLAHIAEAHEHRIERLEGR